MALAVTDVVCPSSDIYWRITVGGVEILVERAAGDSVQQPEGVWWFPAQKHERLYYYFSLSLFTHIYRTGMLIPGKFISRVGNKFPGTPSGHVLYKHIASVLASFEVGGHIFASCCSLQSTWGWTTQRDAAPPAVRGRCASASLSPSPVYQAPILTAAFWFVTCSERDRSVIELDSSLSRGVGVRNLYVRRTQSMSNFTVDNYVQ